MAEHSVKIGADVSGLNAIAVSFKNIGDQADATSRKFSDFATRATKNIDDIKNRFGVLPTQFGKVFNNPSNDPQLFVDKLGKLQAASKASTYAFQSLSRVISDLPFGPGGIANNIDQLPGAFQRLAAAAKESGQSIGSVLLQSLKGPGGLLLAFSGVSAAMSIATFGLGAWTRIMGNSKSATQEAAEALKKYRESLDSIDESSRKSAQQEIAHVQVLASIAQDATASYTTRKNAIEELNKTYPGYFGNLNTENSLNKDLSKNIEDVTRALLAKAAAQAAEKKFAEASERVYDLVIKQRDALKEANAAAANFSKTYERINSSSALAARESSASILQSSERNAKAAKNAYDTVTEALKGARAEQMGFLTDAQNSAKEAAGLIIKPKPDKSTGKTQEEKISEIMDKLKADRESLSRDPLIPDLDKPEKDIRLIEDAIKRLLEIKVPVGSSIIEKLIGMEDFDKLIAAELKKNVSKFATDEPVAVPVYPEIKPVSDGRLNSAGAEAFRKVLFDQLSKSGITTVTTKEGVRVPITPFVSTDLLQQGYRNLQTSLQAMSDLVLSSTKSLQVSIATGLGDALGEALTGGNVGGVIIGLFSSIGDAVSQLGQQMIALSPLIAGIKLAFSSLNPGGLLLGGLGLVALGGIIKNIAGKSTPFAAGGIVSGPVNALVGEYPGASSNPEVIAPLNKLKSLLDLGGGGSQVFIPDVTLKGTDLVIAFSRAQKYMGR